MKLRLDISVTYSDPDEYVETDYGTTDPIKCAMVDAQNIAYNGLVNFLGELLDGHDNRCVSWEITPVQDKVNSLYGECRDQE